MDFYQIKERVDKRDKVVLYPDFVVCRSKDLMVRGKGFYAVWDETKGLWSTDEYEVQRLIDEELSAYHKKRASELAGSTVVAHYTRDYSNKMWKEFRDYMSHISDTYHQIDAKLTFLNTEVKKKDYVSKRLPYPLEAGTIEAYDEIISTLYSPEERAKIEWAIGAIVSGDATDIQKFIVFYGEGGTGKSTILNIIQKLFEGYYTTFEAKALTSSSNGFSTEVFRSNPLVAIQHDGDLSRIEDNTKLNSIISHEQMVMNEKYKPSYTARANCFLFMATNRPVKITDARSGIIRRLIDVHPTGNKIPVTRYFELMSRIDFELGAIASHCLAKYQEMGKNFYAAYRPLDMILQTDTFFNFVELNVPMFLSQGGVSLSQAYEMYKLYCDEALVEFKLPRHKFREELKAYFDTFSDITRVDGKQVRSYYSGLILNKFTSGNIKKVEPEKPSWLNLDSSVSLLDVDYSGCIAQYAGESETPKHKWVNVKTHLSDLDTSKVHYILVPEKHIVIDFDLRDESGKKSPTKNLEAASLWPPTYAEYSKSGAGLHLHYIWNGDKTTLARLVEPGIEILTFAGDSALRRRLTKCNTIPIATINTGLPMKEEKKVINFEGVTNEKGLRTLIKKNLRKEIHPGTHPSVDFIHTILEKAYADGVPYDVSDMRPAIMAFANNSTNHASACLRLVADMKFKTEEPSMVTEQPDDERLVFFDVEVFPNLVMVNWKYQGVDGCVHMINPTPQEIEPLFKKRLVGFNCRRYDNHILYAIYVGKTIPEIYEISSRIIGDSKNALFGEAYNISYTDVFDFSSVKKSLKKWQIELGIHHQELGLPWDKPVPEDLWGDVAAYCDNDVVSLEKVFDHLKPDYLARKILAELSGLTPNDTTQMHTARIIFGNDPRPQDKFVYTNLGEKLFPGYKYESGKSTYRGEEPGEGGYIHAEPGYYEHVALLDVASMHPTSIEELNLFGPYTEKYSQIKRARLAIKHKQYDVARSMLGGVLGKYLDNPKDSKDLAFALKIAINIVYGLTSASFDNKFRDRRNRDNIVAKRGALFMIDLKHAVQEKGYIVAHIKTDSIKIPNADPEIIKFVFEFGKKYGYDFEHEATYDKFCLINDSVYIAKYSMDHKEFPGEWTATGAEFAHPYLFKTLFSRKPIEFSDLGEAKTVTSAMYLDMNENLPDGEHSYRFVGKAGLFCPVKPGCGGGILLREKDGKYNSVSGTKGYRWIEAEVLAGLHKESDIDMSYYEKLVADAVKDISKFIDLSTLVS